MRHLFPEDTSLLLTSLTSSDRRMVAKLLENGPLSRAELADTLGVSRPAVTQMIASLERHGLIEEHESRRGARGQPARPIGIRGDAGFAVGVNFSYTYVDLAMIDLTGHRLAERRMPLPAANPDSLVEVVKMALGDWQRSQTMPNGTFVGIGIALPGDFQLDSPRLISHRYFPAFDQMDMRAFLQPHFDQPVFVENNGRANTMGERLAGHGRRSRNFMLVHIGYGMGGGLILDNRLYRGAHLNAGPMGTFFPMDRPRPSGQDLLLTLQAAGFDVTDFDALDAIEPAWRPVIDQWCERAGRQLASALQHVSDVLDPEFIVLGGLLPVETVEAVTAMTGMPNAPIPGRAAGAPPVVLPSRLGSKSVAIGAAAMPVLDLLLP